MPALFRTVTLLKIALLQSEPLAAETFSESDLTENPTEDLYRSSSKRHSCPALPDQFEAAFPRTSLGLISISRAAVEFTPTN